MRPDTVILYMCTVAEPGSPLFFRSEYKASRIVLALCSTVPCGLKIVQWQNRRRSRESDMRRALDVISFILFS